MGRPDFIGVDIFAGAGGLSLGAEMANINVILAVEQDKFAASTYAHNHPDTRVMNDDTSNISNISNINAPSTAQRILFGGPPCQGFSYSNQRTRNRNNPKNWLLREFIRIMYILKNYPIWFPLIYGFINTENKIFLNSPLNDFESKGYTCTWRVLNARDFGVPQARSRFFMIASMHGYEAAFPVAQQANSINVDHAIADLPHLPNGARIDYLEYQSEAANSYAEHLRGDAIGCTGHLVTQNAVHIIERYRHIPPGSNWEDIPEHLMKNYTDRTRCHTGLYHRLNHNEPAVTIGNYRKAMLIHPREDRGLSVREATKLQSFPDSYEFKGSIGFQQQQVGNAVPPLLAKAVFYSITNGGYNV